MSLLAASLILFLQSPALIREPVAQWPAYEAGFKVDHEISRSGRGSARCVATTASEKRGASLTLTLNQTVAQPVVVSGFSKANGVGGSTDSDYSIYIDATYLDGQPLWGVVAPFSVGTHDWQQRRVLVQPTKPLKTLTVYAMFRNHVGSVWFDGFSARVLEGPGVFDSQPLELKLPQVGKAVSTLSAGDHALAFDTHGQISGGGGFLLRDVAKGQMVAPIGTKLIQGKDGVGIDGTSDGVDFMATVHREGSGLGIDGQLTGSDRAVTLYFAVPVNAVGWQWGDDIRTSRTITKNAEYSNLTNASVGATGGISIYPFACITDGKERALMLSNGMEWPTVHRIFYNEANSCLVIAWDFALTKDHPAKFHCRLDSWSGPDAAWGFRTAAERFYAAHAAAFERRATQDGIWIPFNDPSKVHQPQDFGIAYHEGDNSIASDKKLGILSFRYTEPMSYWMPMAPSEPRTYANAIRLLHERAKDNQEAAAAVNSAILGIDGKLQMEFRKEPWCDGALFVLNPNPKLPGKPTKANINYDPVKAAKQYAEGLGGEYLDSLEAWSQYNDYDPAHMAACPYPLTFDTDGRPALPQWFSTYGYASWLSEAVHIHHKLLLANSTPIQYSVFAGILDVMGIEVNWLDNNRVWQPDSDAVFNKRRTLCYRKPYLLLQNTNFNNFTHDHVRRYFERSMFYAVFPSMFSADAATQVYWDDAKLYERDRDLFKQYIPLISRLSAAGWEPVTRVRASKLWVERYGSKLLTIFNNAESKAEDAIHLEPSVKAKELVDVLTGERFKVTEGSAKVTVGPERCRVLQIH